ncbi:hypothetical protein [Dictyobacter kobayashii]|uniref:Glycosyltransferase RgtA/B/C/D-like domain-containing protein n=1 Tax=Dictyobacter kobayashii TaxID=2014872 RepID=A0A402AGW4_9CHLR|nr:hypothetical protein [Dictyobacter kobayashii]GCE18361.1 hypothetical protein KDK_21610 [Dictyobacter kobayashii]
MQAQETTKDTTATAEAEGQQHRWRTALIPWRQAALAALPAFLLTRLLLLVLTYFGGILFNAQGPSSFAFTPQSILYNWYHWDATRNLTIATQGYTDPSYTALFPLYPTIVHALSSLLHMDILLAGMIISNLAFFGALMVCYLLVEPEFDASMAKRCMLYLAIFPTALFFFAAYNTALLLFFTLLCLYLLRQRSWWLAGCIGALAALTDLMGIFLFIVFVCEFFRQQGPQIKQVQTGGRGAQIRSLLPLIAALFIPIGLLIYSYALKKPFHDALIFLHPQQGNPSPGFLGGLFTALHTLSGGSPFSFATAHALFELLILLGIVILLVMSFIGREQLPKGQWPLQIFGILVIIYALLVPNQPGLPFSQFDPLPSIQYAALLCIPAFLVLARLGRYPWVHQTYLLFATPLLALLVFQMFKVLWAM